MQSIFLGLTLLFGVSVGQHSVVRSNRDLFEQSHDQLIDYDASLEAVESRDSELSSAEDNSAGQPQSSGQLPFGARVSVSDQVQRTFSYRVGEPVSDQEIVRTPSVTKSESESQSFLYFNPNVNFMPQHEHTEQIQSEFSSPLTPLSQKKDVYTASHNSEYVGLEQDKNQQFIPPSDIYIPPFLESRSEPQSISVEIPSDAYLPPFLEFKTEPPTTTTTTTTTTPFHPIDTYLPPFLEFKTEQPVLPPEIYLPPFLELKTEPPPQPTTSRPKTTPRTTKPPSRITTTKSIPLRTTRKKLVIPSVTTLPPQPPPDNYLPPFIEFKTVPPVPPPPPIPPLETYLPPVFEYPQPLPPYQKISPPPITSPPTVYLPPKYEPKTRFTPVPIPTSTQIPPIGVVGEYEKNTIKPDVLIPIKPPFGVVGEYEEPNIEPKREHLPAPYGLVVIPNDEQIVPISHYKPAPYGATEYVQDEKIVPTSHIISANSYGVIGQHQDESIRPHSIAATASPYGIISEYQDNSIIPHSESQSMELLPALTENNPACVENDECSEEQICSDGLCVNACVLAVGLCIGNAVCQTRRHTPGCVCPDMFTAITVRDGYDEKYDCMAMVMMAAGPEALTVARSVVPISGRYRFPIAPLLPIAPIAVFPNSDTQGRITTASDSFSSSSSSSSSGGGFFNSARGDACSPTPCGPNTRCETNTRGIALCRCLDDFVPDGNTINGCKPQCTIDQDCPDDYRCQATKCVRVCVAGACGHNADCQSRNHRAICSCPSGHQGNPDIRCSREQVEVRAGPPAPPLDPCAPNPCGVSAGCRVRGDRPVCSCPVGFEGDPLVACKRAECTTHRDCPGHQACKGLKCIDPCKEGICGQGSECTTRSNQPICSCPRGFVGDPFTSCRRFDPEELCSPTPCGQNTNCKVRNERAVCSCIDNYVGNPLTGCRPECVSDTECPHNMACQSNRCVNPCRDACGENAICDVRNGRAICSCPEFYKGDAHRRCFPECTQHDDCPSYQACYQLQCANPCTGACGTGADCKVENHKPICSCPKGYTGHPFETCRPFTKEDLCSPNPCGSQADCTPGFDRSGNDRPVCTCPKGYIGNPLVSCQRGECEDHDHCPAHQACYGFTCQNPCYTDKGSVCGLGADCNTKKHQPVCSCPPGYDGNPLTECRPAIRASSFIAGRTKK